MSPNSPASRPLRIGVDVREWERGKMTGIGRYLLNFLSYAARQRPHFRFFLYGNQRSAFPELAENAQPRVIRERLTFWWDQVSLSRRLRRDGVQIFLSPYPKGPLMAPCPYLSTIHDLLFLKVPEYAQGGKAVYNRFFRASARLYSRRASRVITDSEHSRQDLTELLGLAPDKVCVIPIGLLPRFRPVQDAQACMRYGVSGRFVLYVGNFKPHKNLIRLLKAFRWVREEGLGKCGDSWNLALAGHDPKHRPAVEQMVRQLGLEDSVIWTGLVEDDDLPALYSTADVFVFPSLYEGFGLPALEAMACGTAVIASRTTSLPEVVGEAGLLVDPEDSAELGKSLLKLLTDKELRSQLEERGLKRVQQFSLAATSGRLLELIEQVAEAGFAPRRKGAKPR